MGTIQVYISNLGRFAEKECLVGEWVRLPLPEEKLSTILNRIGIDGNNAEVFITDYETAFSNLEITEYSSIAEVNNLARRLDELSDSDLDKLAAVLECESKLSIAEIIQYIEQLDNFALLYDVHDEHRLGLYFAEELGVFDSIPTHLRGYIDYSAYGTDIRISGNGLSMFCSFGYLLDNR